MGKILREFFMPTDNDYRLEQKILESKEGEKSLVLRGIFAQAQVKNRNGRIYPLSVLESECYNMQKVIAANGGIPGELDHPKEPQPELKNAAILIKSIKQDGNNFIGEAKVMSTTTSGATCYALAKEGLRLGTSTRGLGELHEQDGQTYVREGYRWLTNDVVGDPSAPEAWCDSILEGKHYELTNGVIQESTILEYKSAIHSLKKEELVEGVIDLYKNFLDEVELGSTNYKYDRVNEEISDKDIQKATEAGIETAKAIHSDNFDEDKAKKVIDGVIKKHKGKVKSGKELSAIIINSFR